VFILRRKMLFLFMFTALIFSSGCAVIQTAVAVGVAYGLSKAAK
jgi:hypothetical protein